ncbi:Tyrosine-protein phosphatase YwqE [compost metagenome]
MFGLFKKKVKSETPFVFPKVDIHSHLIPGIDDGSPDMDTTISYLRALKELGYEKVITTPHVMIDQYQNNKEIILYGRDAVREAITSKDLKIDFDAAAEYFLDEQFIYLIKQNELLHFGKDKYVLFEMSFMQESLAIERVIFELLSKGYTPLLAHPERYNYYLRNYDRLFKFKELGCKFQLNINSLTGYYGSKQKELGVILLKEGLVDLLGTDLHHERHLNTLRSLKITAYSELLNSVIKQNNELL